MFLGNRAALNISANAAGYRGTLPADFVLAGHSAGGGFAASVGGYYAAAARALRRAGAGGDGWPPGRPRAGRLTIP